MYRRLLFCQVPVETLAPYTFTSSVFIFLAGIAFILGIYEYWFRSLRSVKLANQIPGPKTIPIIGNAHIAIGRNPAGEFKYIPSSQENLTRPLRILENAYNRDADFKIFFVVALGDP